MAAQFSVLDQLEVSFEPTTGKGAVTVNLLGFFGNGFSLTVEGGEVGGGALGEGASCPLEWSLSVIT